jgi:GNAT superfamily N-acetyltransferase
VATATSRSDPSQSSATAIPPCGAMAATTSPLKRLQYGCPPLGAPVDEKYQNRHEGVTDAGAFRRYRPRRGRRDDTPPLGGGAVRVPARLAVMQRALPGGVEIDDDPGRIDVAAVHRYLAGESYWASGRSFETVERLVREASRVVGLYHDGALVGFARAVSDGVAVAYLADVYVLPGHCGQGLGEELVREIVERGELANVRWLLHTRDVHALYAKVGFGRPGERLMERPIGG